MIGAILGAAIPAIASLWGAHKQNQENKKEAEKQRQFQAEQAASTAQRGVQDFIKAGLNPALAYGSQAPAMQGSKAEIGNAVEGAVSGAKQWRLATEQLALQRAETASKLETEATSRALMRAQGGREFSQAALTDAQRASTVQQMTFGLQNQPGLLRTITAQAIQNELGIPAARNAATLEMFLANNPRALAMRQGPYATGAAMAVDAGNAMNSATAWARETSRRLKESFNPNPDYGKYFSDSFKKRFKQ